MASREHIDKKVDEIKLRLYELGHVPSQKENRVIYASVKYYYTNYPLHPVVRELMEVYPLSYSRSRETMTHEESIAYLQTELSRLGKIPGPTENRTLYSKVKYFYENYSDIPEIAELMERFPLVKQKKPSVFVGMSFDEKIDWLESQLVKHQRIPSIYTRDCKNVASNVIRLYKSFSDNERVRKLMYLFPTHEVFDRLIEEHRGLVNYIFKCVELYGALPGEKSIPMCELSSKCRSYNYRRVFRNGKLNPYIQLVISLREKGINSPRLESIFKSIKES